VDRFGLDTGMNGPLLGGMGFSPKLTPAEIEAAKQAKIDKMVKKLFTKPREAKGLYGLADVITGERGDTLNTYYDRLDKYRKAAKQALGGDTPSAVIDEKAFSLYSVDCAKPDFDLYKAFTGKYLKQVANLSVGGVIEGASANLQRRVEFYPLDVPFFGSLTLNDVKLNKLSIDSVIQTVDNLKWDDVSKSAIATFAPRGGFADTGMKCVQIASDVATSVATAASTLGAVGLSAGIGTALAAIMPWVLAAIALIAIGEYLYGWLSGADDEDKQEAQFQKAWEEANALTEAIQDLLFEDRVDTNFVAKTIALRVGEMAAYGSTIRDSLWTDCTAITRSDERPAAFCGDPRGVRADGSTTRLVAVREKSSKGETKKKIMMQKVRYLRSLLSYLQGFEAMGDRRIAFEYLGMTLMPNSNGFSTGLWDAGSYSRNPLVMFKPPVRTAAETGRIKRATVEASLKTATRVININENRERQFREIQAKYGTRSADLRVAGSGGGSSGIILVGAAAAGLYLLNK
jgi:hypothetical protein